MNLSALTVITPTCRTEPRFQEMADSIAGQIPLAGPYLLTWVVVDDRLWYDGAAERRAKLVEAVAGRFQVVHLPPKPSPWRGPARVGPRGEGDCDLPDHNGARNTGLAVAMTLYPASDHYILFVDDCTVLSQSVFTVAQVAAEKNAGLRVPISVKRNIAMPRDGRVPFGESGGLHLVPAKAVSVAGGCFGAPLEAFLRIGGFDEIYSGEAGKEDLDATVRIERLGVKWLTTKRCTAIQLLESHTKGEVTGSPEALAGRKNAQHWNALIKDRSRTLPVAGIDLDQLSKDLLRDIFYDGETSGAGDEHKESTPVTVASASGSATISKDDLQKIIWEDLPPATTASPSDKE